MDCFDPMQANLIETTLTPEEQWESITDSFDALDAADTEVIVPDQEIDNQPAVHGSFFNDEGSFLNAIVDTSLVSVVARNIVDAASFFFTSISPQEARLLVEADFTNAGSYDPINECAVMGDVARDIDYIDAQTGPTCSLMAQEQFVERYIHQDIPEDVLEWRAETWGYYQSEGLDAGTNWMGQAAMLEHFDIPHSRETFATVDDLNGSLQAGNDVLIGVDSRSFYGDSSLPPGSGHAVAIVGWGADPNSMEIRGYYVTDSNFPGTVRFMSPEALDKAWYHDMISIATTYDTI